MAGILSTLSLRATSSTKEKTVESPERTTTDRPQSQSILHRIAGADKNAVQECIDTYGGWIWTLAKKHTGSVADAEDAVLKIFIDIWKYAPRFDSKKFDDAVFIALIARRRLIMYSSKINKE